MREFVLNYRHPGPRRVWKGGSEPRLRDRINGIAGITGIAGIIGIRGCVPKWALVETKHYFAPQEWLQPAPDRPRPPGRPPAASRVLPVALLGHFWYRKLPLQGNGKPHPGLLRYKGVEIC